MNYFKIEHEDVCNGTGLRCTIWLTSCSHRCSGCFNKESWNPNSGIPFDESARQEIFNELSKDYISGLTLTGGDPLHENNLDEVLKLIKEIRILFPDKTIWLYTGFEWDDIMCSFAGLQADHIVLSEKDIEVWEKRREIIFLCNIVIDGEYIDEQKDLSLKFRGSKNQRVIDVQKSLAHNKIILYCD